MRFKLIKHILFVVLIVIPILLYSETIVIDSTILHEHISESVFFLEDVNNNYSLKDICTDEIQKEFIHNRNNQFRFSVDIRTYWLKFVIKGENLTDTNFICKIRYIDIVDFYYPVGGEYKKSHSGIDVPYFQRPINNKDVCFPINITSNSQIFYARLSFDSKFVQLNNRDVEIVRSDFFYEKQLNLRYFHGSFLGIMIAMMLLNLVFYIIIKDINYLYFILFSLFSILYQFSITDLFTAYIFPNYPHITKFLPYFFGGLFYFPFIMFSREFLQSKKYTPILDKIMIISMFIMIIIIFGGFFINFNIANNCLFIMGFFGVIITTIVAIIVIRKNHRPGIFFLIANGGSFVAFIGYMLLGLQIIPYSFIVRYSLQASEGFRSVLFSTGLADRFNSIKKALLREKIEKIQIEKDKEQEMRNFYKEQNIILENTVEKRTCELVAQTKILEKKNQYITASINYASRIQYAIFPPQKLIDDLLPNHFIFYKPLEVVSGDFFWIKEDRNLIYLTITDCTGHGVPGAFMSMLGITYLNEIITQNKFLNANQILQELRTKVKQALHQEIKNKSSKDGMDIGLCIIDKSKKIMQFSGAHHSLYLYRNDNLVVFKADKMPIGIYYNERDFTNYEIELQNSDMFYLFTDGVIDQFGQNNNKRFTTKRLLNIFQSIHSNEMRHQKKLISEGINNWKGNNQDQIDDMLMLGFKCD